MNFLIRTDLTEAEAWDVIDTMTDEQIGALGLLFPPRCIQPDETLDAHHRYAGKVELVQKLATRRAANPRPLRVDASDPKSIERLAQADVHTGTAADTSAARSASAPSTSGSPASATARATHARASQASRRAGRR